MELHISIYSGPFERLERVNFKLLCPLLFEPIRGYGHVKDEHLKKAKIVEASLLAKFGQPAAPEQKKAA